MEPFCFTKGSLDNSNVLQCSSKPKIILLCHHCESSLLELLFLSEYGPKCSWFMNVNKNTRLL